MQLLAEHFKKELNAIDAPLEEALENINCSSDLENSGKEADLMTEAIPENLAINKEWYTKLASLAPQKTIFATNTSTLLPNMFAVAEGRPEKFLSLHIAKIWKHNTEKIMGIYNYFRRFSECN